MGFVTTVFIKPKKPALCQPPHGSFTINGEGHIMTSTLPHSFSNDVLQAVGNLVVSAFRSADHPDMQPEELVIKFAALKLLARRMRDGFIVFFLPRV